MKEEAIFNENQKIEDWPWIIDELNNWVTNDKDFKTKCFEDLNKFIRESQIGNIMDLLESNFDYKGNRKITGNRYTHFNQFKTVYSIRNLDKVTTSKILNKLESDLTHYFIRYFALLVSVREDFFRSSDYIDYLDAELTPPEEALNWVSSIANDLLNDVVYKNRPDVAQHIIDNSKMHWELLKETQNK